MGTRGRWGSTRGGKGDAEAFEKVSERAGRLYVYIDMISRNIV